MYLALTIIILIVFLLMTFGGSAMMMNFLFLIIGGLVVWAIIMRNKALQENINSVPEETLHVVNLEKGGVFELSGVGRGFKNYTLKVLAKHLYMDGDFSWFELECDDGTENKVWVEVEDDDETVVSVVLEKTNLKAVGLTPELLKQIDYDESGRAGKGYVYSDSGNATYYRFCDDTKAEKLYYWDFIKGNKILSVEKWGDNDYQVFISQKMRPSQIRVLRNKG